MAVYYESGREIGKISAAELKTIATNDISKDKQRLSAALLAERNSWAEIYLSWIEACVNQMWRGKGRDETPREERVRTAMLFQEGADQDECETFLDEYRAMLVNPNFPHVGNPVRSRRICGEVDKKLAQAPAYLRLRVKAVCLLADCEPQALFSQGAGWAGVLCAPQDAAKLQSSEITVQKNAVFDLNPCAGLGKPLLPRTLVNKSEDTCRIEIRCGSIKYPVRLPAYGALRAVFADDETMVSLKGCISCCDTQTAVVQRGSKEGIRLFYASCGNKAAELEPVSLLWDACADEVDGVSGALVLTANELYSTLTGLRAESGGQTPLPVRCYRAGNQWALLYANGELDLGLSAGDRTRLRGITAVAEDAERGLLFCREGKSFDCRNNFELEVPMEVFVSTMLSRFTQAKQGECEVQRTGYVRWAILDSGEVAQ